MPSCTVEKRISGYGSCGPLLNRAVACGPSACRSFEIHFKPCRSRFNNPVQGKSLQLNSWNRGSNVVSLHVAVRPGRIARLPTGLLQLRSDALGFRVLRLGRDAARHAEL